MIAAAVDGVAKAYAKFIDEEILMNGEVQDWFDGEGPRFRTGPA